MVRLREAELALVSRQAVVRLTVSNVIAFANVDWGDCGIPGMAGFGFGDATVTEEERHKRQGIVPLRLSGLGLGTHTQHSPIHG
jgi:hypothetical protein